MFQYDNATWVVDANANCKVNYAVQGDVRLIRIPNTGTTRDTIVLPGMRGSGAGAIIVNDIAYVSAGGEANLPALAHRARTARLALALRCAGVRLAARATPPFKPPLRPRVTAALLFFILFRLYVTALVFGLLSYSTLIVPHSR